MFDTSVQYVKGVGPYIAKLLAKREIETVGDLLYHIPFRYIDRRQIDEIKSVSMGQNKTIIGEVVTSGITWIGRKRKKIFEVIVKDGTGTMSGKWFNFHAKYMEGRFPAGSKVLLAGEVSEYSGTRQFIHPEIELLDTEEDGSFEVGGKLLPIYPSTDGLSQRQLRKIIKAAWEKYSDEFIGQLPPEILEKHNLLEAKKSLYNLHFPDPDTDLTQLNIRRSEFHRSLIFEEFFMFELALSLKKNLLEERTGITFEWSDDRMKAFCNILSFELTGAQQKAIRQIKYDMTSSRPMNRLLQGDVGSGKTVVALAAAIQAIENGYQVAFMAPTEILAEQHFKNVSKYAEQIGIACGLITSSVKGSMREKIYDGIKSGTIHLIFGTHALIQEDLQFNKLGFIVIDEQHRFGVMQRAALHKKGADPDILVMTATPIPRTLAMTVYGDLDVTILDEMPAGRRPTITKLYRDKQVRKLYDGMRKELEKGHQIYVVYPLIEESEKVDLKNATEMSKVLKGIFEPKYRVELLHGRMKSEEKEKIMATFKDGNIGILAATSVVEVGVDVANATVMVIEHAERFGLSQLHQLRGRVGRSDLQSYCILMASWRQSDEAKRRLNIMQGTNDGFKIAEEDLAIRGPGEFMGTRQSGLPDFHIASIVADSGILEVARHAAFEIDLDQHNELRETVMRLWGSKLELTKA
jgi:ATP-dependent DNA helicase RecG